ncbi:DUF1499 domain-containing protein [Pseudorhodobacter ferrugineus]|uniref:DUF1499 domain-containing protein n=1 Tax=Pseudorhodobacter ferrugineus TaxID=77008 RepID=UPI0003B4192F|nr:DUF1499 domain-containing protein [Pseudorhodobacter ferrugineus]
MFTTLALILFIVSGFAAYVRFAPSDPARWTTDPSQAYAWDHGIGWNEVLPQTGGAILRIPAADGLLARLDAVAMATPRTMRLAGSVEEGRITWITRSGLWGFPDYTTAQLGQDGVYIHARLRFGQSDLGVNAARLATWQSKL